MSRELDCQIAEKVMDVEVEASPNSCDPKIMMYRFRGDCIEIPHYSTIIGAAFQVVEKMTCTTKQWFRCEQSCITWEATFAVEGDGDNDFEATAEGDSMPEAICKAALLALRSKETK